MLKLYCIALLVFPLTLFSQTITGKIYDTESMVNGAKIYNINQDITTYSDEKGDFKIRAQVNDSLAITSVFYEPQIRIINQKDFDDVVVIELKKTVNELNKVYVNKANEKKFEASKVENQMNTQIKNDVELRPELYNPPPNTNMNFIAIAGLITKLFKKRNVEEPKQLAEYSELQHLFQTDSFFNANFLSSELKLEKEYHPLFIDFCEAKGIEKTLLLKENQLPLMDTLVQYGKEFKAMIQEEKKD